LGVSTGFEMLLDAGLETAGVDCELDVDVVKHDVLLVLFELELVGVGAGAALATVVVTSCVTVGPGLTT
jgi:hypothetical protein